MKNDAVNSLESETLMKPCDLTSPKMPCSRSSTHSSIAVSINLILDCNGAIE